MEWEAIIIKALRELIPYSLMLQHSVIIRIRISKF
jgi:hypothetical protein